MRRRDPEGVVVLVEDVEEPPAPQHLGPLERGLVVIEEHEGLGAGRCERDELVPANGREVLEPKIV